MGNIKAKCLTFGQLIKVLNSFAEKHPELLGIEASIYPGGDIFGLSVLDEGTNPMFYASQDFSQPDMEIVDGSILCPFPKCSECHQPVR